MNPEKTLNHIIDTTVDYITKNGIKSLVIGLSGGIDSTVVCVIADLICHITGSKLIGVSLPTQFNKEREVKIAKQVGYFCDDFRTIPIDKEAQNLYEKISESKLYNSKFLTLADKIRRANIMARIRMIYLMHIAHLSDGMVLSTNNLTEYLLGFWTLHGDVGDYGMLQNYWKTEVYELAEHLVARYSKTHEASIIAEAIHMIPTDGNGITNSDFEQLGATTYAEIDRILIEYLDGNKVHEGHPVIQQHKNSFYKRKNPCNVPRLEVDLNIYSFVG